MLPFFFVILSKILNAGVTYFSAIRVDGAPEKQQAINPGVLQVCVSAASVDSEGQEEAAQQDRMSTVGKAAR